MSSLRETKERFSLRKNKKYKNLVSVGLGLFVVAGAGVVAGNEAQASEATTNTVATTENPATNSPEVQPVATVEATNSLENTGTATGSVTVDINKEEVDTAVAEAKEAGVKVEKEADVNKGTATTIEEARVIEKEVTEEYKKQAENIKEVTTEYVKYVAEHKATVNKVVEENKQLQADYEAKVEKYNNEVVDVNKYNAEVQAKYDRELQIFNETVARINKENADSKTEYERAYQTYLTNVNTITEENKEAQAEYDRKLAEYNTEKPKIEVENAKLKADYEKAKSESEKLAKEIEASNEAISAANAEKRAEYDRKLAEYKEKTVLIERKVENLNTIYESEQMALYGDVNENERGSLNYYNNLKLIIKENIEILENPLSWNTNTEVLKIKGNLNIKKITAPSRVSEATFVAKYDVDNISEYDEIKITNVAKTISGKNISLIMTFDNFRVDNLGAKYKADLTIGEDANGTIGFSFPKYDKSSHSIKLVDDNNNPVDIAIANVITDVDWKQGIQIDWNKSKTIYYAPKDSGVDKIGTSYHELNGEAIQSIQSIPKGSLMIAGYGSEFKLKFYANHPDTVGGYGATQDVAGYYFSLYGDSFKGEVYTMPPTPEEPNYEIEKPTTVTPVTPPEYKPLPEIPTPPTVKDLPPSPVEPEYKPLPKAPEKEEFKPTPPAPEEPKYKEIPTPPAVPTVKYHYVNFDVEPNIYKEVKNTEGTNIDKKLVNKLSTVNWELKTETLPVGREEIVSYIITDSFPSGFELNLENTKELSKGFTVEFNKETNTAVFTATKEMIANLNKDLSKEVTPVYPVASGTVVNDGATYVNNFKLDIETNNNNTGNVIVHYVDTNNNTISNDIFDVKNGKTGTTYDTKDNKPTEIAYNGELYKITTTVKGKETGEVVVGNQEVTYVYDKVKLKDKTGTVVVHYVDTKGNTIKNDVVDEKEVPVGNEYTTIDNKPNEITNNGVNYKITTTVKGKETGKVVEGVTEVTYVYERTTPEETPNTYTKYSNKVVVHTPGDPNDPDNPTNNLIKPEKEDLNKDGIDINGTVVPLNSTNYYVLKWDLDQYKGIKSSLEEINKGFFYIDDYPEEALTLNEKDVKLIDSNGKEVAGIKVEAFTSVANATDEVKTMLEKAQITTKGAFQLFRATNPEEFYKNYVVAGNSISITTPMTVKEELKGKDTVYINKGYQVDFGNGYETNEVENKVVTPKPEKDNKNNDGIVINGKQVVVGMTNNYNLTWDLSKYTGIKSSKDEIAKGFYYIDDYPEEAVTINSNEVKLTDSKGQAVSGVSVKVYNNVDELPTNLKETLVKNNVSIKGAFQVFTADNPGEFYNKYVTTGETITIVDPMTVKEELKGKNAEYKNKAYQIDYNNVFETKVVTNNVVTPDPDKQNLNKDGIDINGLPVVVGSTNYFTMKWDLDQFKGISASKEDIAKGFYYIDDYPEEAVTINSNDVKLTDSKGQAVSGVSVKVYNNVDELPTNLKETLAKNNVSIKGAFQVFTADNPGEFYSKYVTTGETITIVDPMTVKDELKGKNASYKNKAYQSDFGNVALTEVVGNHVPNVDPTKENTNKDGININGTPMYAGATNYYKLTWDLDQYKGIKASKEDVAKGFYYIDDYPEEALTVNASSEEVKSIFAKSGITTKGAFQLFTAVNPEQFYNDYVATGTSIKITSPMTVKNAFNGDYENKAYQVDFGNGYETELVINNVPKVEPKKENTDKSGVNIDGKTVLAGSVNYYKLIWDLDQYKGIKASKEDVAKGFYYIDDYPEEALTVNSDGVTLVTTDGKAVEGVKVELVESLEKATDEVKSIFAKSGIAPKGAFQLFTAVNPEQFYNDYVATGTSINIVSPMTVKKEMINVGGEYENKAYQVDFGNGYETEVVVNNTPKITPEKDVVVDLSNSDKSLDGKTIALNTVFNYRLTGGLVPSNRADEITQYGFIDDYDQKGDQYDGVYMAFANVDITLNDGTIVKKGTEITKYTTQNVDTKDGKLTIEVDKQFLTTVSKDSEFQVDVYLQMKRISVGEFENTFVNTINGVETISNTVKTNTPEPPKPEVPEQPKEEKPKPEVPEAPKVKKELPKTSAVKGTETNSNNSAVAGLGALALAGAMATRRRKEEK